MKNATRLTSILVFLMATCGVATTAIGTIGVCCKNVYYFVEPPGEECSGTSTTVCDDYSTSDPNGKRSTGMRTAVCTTYTTSSFARLPCDSAMPVEWVKLPGQGPGGYCCYAYLPVRDSYDLTYQVMNCVGQPCSDQPVEP